MKLEIRGAPIYFELPILGGIPITASLVVTWGVMIIVTCLCAWMTHDMKVRNISKKQAAAEKLYLLLEGLVLGNMGKKWMGYLPLVGALFSLSLGCSLASLLGLWAPTGDINTTMAWALVVFVLITYHKIKGNGLGGYLKSYTEPIFLMTPFNILGEVFTPVSMAFRHFGNIVSGYIIMSLIYAALVTVSSALFGLLPGVVGEVLGNIPILGVGIPAVISLYFDWFGSFIQAFIFCMLTMIFIATAED